MDAQLKKGLIDIYVLALVKNEDTYGYKLLQDVKEGFDVSESTLYPVLRRLEMQGCLSTYYIEHNGRLRKYYKITNVGTLKFDEYKQHCVDIKKIIDIILSRSNHE